MSKLHILILESNPLDAELIITALKESGYDLKWKRIHTQSEFLESLNKPNYDLILADHNLSNFNGLTALKLLKKRDINLPFIFVSAVSNEENVIECLKAGATNYVLKNNLSRIGTVVQQALLEMEEHRKNIQAQERINYENTILKAIRDVNRLITQDKNPESLCKKICNTLIKAQAYSHVFIALYKKPDDIIFITEKGLTNEFSSLREYFENGKLQCFNQAIEKSEPISITTPLAKCKKCPFSDKYIGRFVMQLKYAGEIIGIFSVTIPVMLIKYNDELELFSELGSDIAYALYSIDQEEKRKYMEIELQNKTYDLGKRVNELDCLFTTSKLLESEGISLEKKIYSIIDMISKTWQYPKITAVKIKLNDIELTSGYCEYKRKQEQDIIVDSKKIGFLSVYYQENKDNNKNKQFSKEGGQLIDAIIQMITNYLERDNYYKSLQLSEEKYRAIIEDQTELICQFDIENRILFSNNSFYSLINKTKAEIIGKNFTDFINKNDKNKFIKLMNDFNDIYTTEKIEIEMFDNYIEVQNIVWTIHLISSEKNKKLFQAVGRNITEIKQAELLAKNQEQQLLQADKMVTLGTVISGIAHDINSPNNFILLNIGIIQKIWIYIRPILDEYYNINGDFDVGEMTYSEIREEYDEICSYISSGSERIHKIILQLKNFIRKNKDQEKVEINSVINSSITLLNNFIKKSTDNFSVTYDESNPIIFGNFQQLEQVIVNLLQNACQALETKNDSILLTCTVDKIRKNVIIKVIDTGIGISEEHLNIITEPFFTTKHNTGGTGLGLSVSNSIVKKYDGILNFNSSIGKGTTASLIFPYIEE